MKLLRALLTWEEAPELARLPVAIGRAALGGLVIGPFISALLHAVWLQTRFDMMLRPVYWLYAAGIGALFASAFYVTCGLPQGYLKPIVAGWSRGRARTIRVLVGAAGGMAGAWLSFQGVQHLFGVTIINIGQMNQIMAVDAVIGGVLALVIGAWVQRDLREKQLVAAEAGAHAKALQAQINPHFFFNTLNTVQSLMDTDPAQAKALIGRLSTMFRYTMKAGQQSDVLFSEELHLVEDYLAIERARFGERLRFQLPEVTEDFRLPALLLQPLVENAVRHGIGKRIDGGAVSVRAECARESVRITVENDADADAPLARDGIYQPGHALDNIRQRLELLYAKRASLDLAQDGSRVTATLVMPR